MRVLSLFDGMSCGMLALMKASIPIDRYVAYEVDKYAIQTSTHNFPDAEQRGDVFKADFHEFEGFDMLIGGSPCTYWSIAQSADKRETTASGIGWELFSQYIRALHEAKPKYFVYENNKSMSSEIKLSISGAFGFEPICINSALVSAQNRQRLYWAGKRNSDGTYSKIDVKQPEDRGVLLKDVLDSSEALIGTAVDKRACVVECVSSRGVYSDAGTRSSKTSAGTEQRYEARGGGKTNALTTVQKDNMVIEQIGVFPNSNGEVKNSLGNRIYSSNAKSVTLKANGGGGGAKTGLYAVPVGTGTVKPLSEKEIDYMFKGHQDRRWNSCNKPGEEEKSKCVVANIRKGVPYNVVAELISKEGVTEPTYVVEDGLITVKDKKYPIKLKDGRYVIRKLTVSECKRLQTVPEWYEFPVSNTQAYKMLGNGWTVDVIAHLFQTIKEDSDNEKY